MSVDRLKDVQELRPGLWTWTAPHPEWSERDAGPDGWGPEVRSYAYDLGECLLFFDPIAPPTLVEGLVEAQEIAVLLTCKWHRRSTDECVERFGAHVYLGPESESSELPGGVETRPGGYPDEVIFWIPSRNALVVGDVILGSDHGIRVQPDAWLFEGQTREGLRDSLRPLLELPVEAVLPTHGNPVVEGGRNALAGALES
jgi:hypothetical protein